MFHYNFRFRIFLPKVLKVLVVLEMFKVLKVLHIKSLQRPLFLPHLLIFTDISNPSLPLLILNLRSSLHNSTTHSPQIFYRMFQRSVESERSDGASQGSKSGGNGMDDYSAIVSLPIETTRALLYAAGNTHEDVAAMITEETDKLVATERATLINFDHILKAVKEVLLVLDPKLGGGRGTGHFNTIFDIADAVRWYITEICLYCSPKANTQLKQNALETCREIGKSIASLPEDTYIHNIQAIFEEDRILEDTMIEIANTLTEEERQSFMDSGWRDKMKELADMSMPGKLFPGLPDVVAVMEEESFEEISPMSG